MVMSGKLLEITSTSEKEVKEKARTDIKVDENTLDKTITYNDPGKTFLGCKHYRVGAKIMADCCHQLFTCRLCHDEVISDHKIDRYATKMMMCMHCQLVQPISQKCSNTGCNQTLARYYCDVCKFHDDSPNKDIYHCPDCGLCRIGKGIGIDFYHCNKCNMCLGIGLKDKHKCIENNMKSDCPICHTDLFTSRNSVMLMKCGHPIHANCLNDYTRNGESTCPICSKSIVDMRMQWRLNDRIIQIQPMPVEFANSTADILCSDCDAKNKVTYHFVGLKCPGCGSYNTKVLATHGFPTGDVTINVNEVNNESLMNIIHEVEAEFGLNTANADVSEEDEGEEGDNGEELQIHVEQPPSDSNQNSTGK